MPLRESAKFAVDVLTIFVLGVVYVIGLTVQTALASVANAWRAVTPFSQTERSHPAPRQ